MITSSSVDSSARTVTEHAAARLTQAADKLRASLTDMRPRHAHSLPPGPIIEVETTVRQVLADLRRPLASGAEEGLTVLPRGELDSPIGREKQEAASRKLAELRGGTA